MTPGPQTRNRYTVAVGRLADYPPAHPERATVRAVGWDVEVRQWPSRGAMLTACRMAERGASLNPLQPYRREDRPASLAQP